MFKFMRCFFQSFVALVLFSSSSFVLASEESDMVTPEEIKLLRQKSGVSDNPIQVDVFISREDTPSEMIHTVFYKEGKDVAVTNEEIFKNCHMDELVPDFLNNPKTSFILSLTLTVPNHTARQEESINKMFIFDQFLKMYNYEPLTNTKKVE